MPLTDKQAAFVREYLVDHCATQAAIRAGYSENSANEQGARLLANVSIRREIDRLRTERSERLRIDADEVVRRLDDLYYEALVVGDLATATRCTEALAKCTGAFEKHNRQKRQLTTQEDTDQLEAELRMRGVILNLDRQNAPHLKRPVPPGVPTVNGS